MATKPLPGVPCPDERGRVHLDAFVEVFLVAARRERARALLAGKPTRRDQAIRDFGPWLDPARCARVDHPYDRLPELAARHGDPLGVYVDAWEARTMRLTEALHLAGGRDVIFSVRAGALAFWLSHEDEIYECVVTARTSR